VLPIGLRNILKGGRYFTEGANTLRGDTVGDVNGYNAAMQVLGFAPADLMKQYEENAYKTEKGKAIKAIEKNALKKYYAAMREGDADGMMEAREKLFELGAKYPFMNISEKTITDSVKARERISREMYNGVSLDRKLAPYLNQAAAEAYGD
jgi:flagellar biosynthesis/type III secretory pathway protein FliH